MTEHVSSSDLLKLTADIVAAHVLNNKLPAADLSQLIAQVHASLSDTGNLASSQSRPSPAVPIKKSVTADFIICLEDGKKLKMLKRHLKTSYDLTPEQYRERWGLPSGYPMVAPNYAKKRSQLAKKIGLGKRGKN
ncbi:MAG: MucR family transcriptional regulator [Alphaproteobacteria bacterium]|nr:MucR family transcriptional regulator [Alphaproteobacteria bacterium]